MAAEKYPAETFALWLEHMRNADGSRWSKSKAARELGCARNQITHWSRDGAPLYIGLACQSLAYGKGPWAPFRQNERIKWERPPEPPPPPVKPIKMVREPKPPKPPAPLSREERARRVKGIRWTKAAG